MPAWNEGDSMSRSLMRPGIALAAMLVIALGFATFAGAQTGPAQTAVDVTLVLAIDASGSVEDDRFELQKRGFAAAFRDPRVLQAIRAGDHQSIAVLMLQWTGPPLQEVMVPWTLVRDEGSAADLAANLEGSQRRLMGCGTSLSGAVHCSVHALAAR